MLPTVSIQKIDGGTGVVRPSDTGVLAIIAPSERGTPNEAAAYLRTDVALADFGKGPLVQCAAYVMPECGHPVVLVKGSASTAGAYGAVTKQNGGTSVPTADVVLLPLDAYDVLVTFTFGGTIGAAGILYTYSLDGGQTTSAVQALGTATAITIPDSGVKIDFAAGTILTGETVTLATTAPVDTNADLVDALEALRVCRTPFEMVLVHADADATMVANLDAWIDALALTGRFKTAVCTARARHLDGSETETQYKTYLEGLFSSTTSLNVVVCADVGDVASSIPGLGTTSVKQPRPVGWAVAARAMKVPLGRDPAYVSDGPVAQFSIVDERGNPKYHDEYLHPGLDDLRIATLRSFDGRQGSFITNAPILSPAGSDYVYVQHARTINRACEIAFQILGAQLSRGVAKTPKAGPNGERYIAEGDALRIEAATNSAIRAELLGQVDDIKFSVSRTDDISSNAGATVTGKIESVAFSYIKRFSVTAGFVKAIGQ